MNEDALLFSVMTLSEASSVWGRHKNSITMRLLRLERIEDRVYLRKSGNTYLVLRQDMIKVYGVPKNG